MKSERKAACLHSAQTRVEDADDGFVRIEELRELRGAIDETMRRRTKQLKYNEKHNITPTQIVKAIKGTLPVGGESNLTAQTASIGRNVGQAYVEPNNGVLFAADPIVAKMSKAQLGQQRRGHHYLVKRMPVRHSYR